MHVEKQLRLGLFDPGLSVLDSVDLAPVFDLDFTQARPYAHRIVNKTAATATRASAANRYWLQPADDVGVNVLRYAQNSAINHLNGLLIEGADQNVILQNTIYAGANWSTSGVIVTSDGTVIDLYGGHSFESWTPAAPAAIYQTVALTAVKWIVEALVYTDGSAVTSADMQVSAGASPALTLLATTFEHVGGGVYLAWAVFTATAANWNVGITLKANKDVDWSLLSCYLAAPTGEGGDFPRSPIPNATGAAATRLADVYTHPADNNVGLAAGTIDVEFVAPCAEADAGVNLTILNIYTNANNRIRLYYNAATNVMSFYIQMGGAGVVTAGAAVTYTRGDLAKFRLIYRQDAKLDGTNYAILYSNRGAGWSQLCQSAVQPTGTMVTGATIHFGRYAGLTSYLASFIRRVRIFSRAIVGVPGW